MNRIEAVNNIINFYSTDTCSKTNGKDDGDDKQESEKGEIKETVGVRRGNYIYEYAVYEDVSREFICKVPVEKEGDKDNMKTLGDKKSKNTLDLMSKYKNGIRNSSYELNDKDKHDSIHELIKMAY